jgi:hypothetical protein
MGQHLLLMARAAQNSIYFHGFSQKKGVSRASLRCICIDGPRCGPILLPAAAPRTIKLHELPDTHKNRVVE